MFRLGVLAAAFLLGLGYCATAPHATAEVPWPDPGARVRVEIRGILSEDWWIVAETGGGRFEREMWSNWGPARRANIYRTGDGGLAVIGAGMLAATVALPPRGRPVEVRDVPTSGDGWRYLGAVTLDGGLRFRTAGEAPECIPLYGIGSVPVRPAHQSQHVC